MQMYRATLRFISVCYAVGLAIGLLADLFGDRSMSGWSFTLYVLGLVFIHALAIDKPEDRLDKKLERLARETPADDTHIN